MKFTASTTNGKNKNYFIKEITINKVEDISGQKIHEAFSDATDCAIEIKYHYSDKPDQEYSLRIGGAFKKDDMGNVISQGQTQQVISFFKTMGTNLVLDSDTFQGFTRKELDVFTGKTIQLLKYVYNVVDGKDKFTTFKSFSSSQQTLENYFLSQVSKGWVKNFVSTAQPHPSNVIAGLNF